MFRTLVEIQEAGFLGFVKVADFHANKVYIAIPKANGIYLILRLAEKNAEFLAVNPSRMYYKHLINPAIHSYDVELLQQKAALVRGSIAVYIGKAGGGNHKTSLRTRLKAYLEAGQTTTGKSKHAGGRAIWQLNDAAELLVCWKPSSSEDAIDEEHRLLNEFKSHYNSLPLANWKR
jgi:hypothetical protein